MKLCVLAEAEAELVEATRYYEDRQVGLGLDFYERVAESLGSIAGDPFRFPVYEGLCHNLEFRRATLERFPYIVIYKVLQAETLVIAVAHSSRRPGYWKNRVE